jgi:hypothetical protein
MGNMEQQLLLLPSYRTLGRTVTPDRDCEECFRALREEGWRHVGDGCYTCVFLSPDGTRVVKFADGTGQRATVEAALANPDNPHLPQIFGVMDDVAGYEFVYEAEALEPLNETWDFDWDDEGTYDPRYLAWYRRWKPEYGSWKWGRNGAMKAAIQALAEKIRDTWADWDVHIGNVMVRPSTGELVLNDLIC